MKSGKINLLQKCRRQLWWFAVVLLGGSFWAGAASISFNNQWRFVRADVPQAQAAGFDDRAWETVTLPHTARTEALVTGGNARQWQGICWYRKTFDLPPEARDQEVILRFEGAMNAAEVWVNGQSAGKFMGGYLPYVSQRIRLGSPKRRFAYR